MYSLASRLYVHVFLRSVVLFSFRSSFLPFRMYSSAVFFSLFLFSSTLRSLSARLSSAQLPFLHSLRWGPFIFFFAFPPVVAVTSGTPFFLLFRFPSAFVHFAYFPYSCFLLVWWFPLSSFRIFSPASVTLLQGCLFGCFCLGLLFSLRLLRLCFLKTGGGGGGLRCLCPLSTFRSVCSLRFVLRRVCVASSVF